MNGEKQKARPKGINLTKGTLENEIRIGMLLLGQRPPRYAGVGTWKVMVDGPSDQMVRRCVVCFRTIRHWGRATHSVDQYTWWCNMNAENARSKIPGDV